MRSNAKSRMLKLKSRLPFNGQYISQNPTFIKGAEYAVRFILSSLLSGAVIFSGYAPFGIAMVAASGAGLSGLASFIGAVFGYLIALGVDGALKYIAISMLIYSGSFILAPSRIYKLKWFMPAIAAAITAITGFVYVIDAGFSLASIVLYLTEIVLTGGCAYFYKLALSPWSGSHSNISTTFHTVSVLILLSTCFISLSALTFTSAHISIGRILAFLTVALIAYSGGFGVGSACGVCMGIAMDCAAAAAPFFSMAYGFTGFLSGVFSRHGKFMFILSFILSNAVSVLWTFSSAFNIAILYEVFAVSVIFMILPESITGLFEHQLTEYIPPQSSRGTLEYTKARIDKLSNAFSDLYTAVNTSSSPKKNDNDISLIFDRAADAVCKKCSMCFTCWRVAYTETKDALNNASRKIAERGRFERSDLPEHFADRCCNLTALTAAINTEYKAMLYRQQLKIQLNENRDAVCFQCLETSKILKKLAADLTANTEVDASVSGKLRKYLKSIGISSDVSVFKGKRGRLHVELDSGNLRPLLNDPDHISKVSAAVGVQLMEKPVPEGPGRITMLQAEPLSAAVGLAELKKKGESVSGDKTSFFKTDDGILYIILSDGMGSGLGAAKESSYAINVLEQFLKAGTDAGDAINLLNSAMLLNGGKGPMSVTVDLMCIDLFTGDARVYKCGAAPSYIKTDKSVKRIDSISMAAGVVSVSSNPPDLTHIKMGSGTLAVILSDGILRGGDDMWLRQMLAEYDNSQPKEFAKNILEAALHKYGRDDDMTVMTVWLESRETEPCA